MNYAEHSRAFLRIELRIFLHLVLSQAAGNSWAEFLSAFNELKSSLLGLGD